MKGAWAEAERVEEVRAAAAGWKRAGAVSGGTFDEISRLYPEPRPFPAPLWRVVTFVLASFVLLAFAGALLAGFSPALRNAAAWCASFGMAFVAIAELQARARSLARRGGVEAAAFWGIVALVVGVFVFFEETLHAGDEVMVNSGLLGAALLFSLGAWRWGVPVFAGFAAAAGFGLLGRAPHGRLLWVLFGVLLSALAERFLDRPSWAPSHRAAAAVVALCAIGAVYAAVNLWSLDHRAVEELRGRVPDLPEPSGGERLFSIAATALVPVLAVAIGLRARRRLFLDAGLVLGALSLVTLRAYVHLADLWVVLAVAGGALVLAALAVNRALARGPGGERGGFTAEPLFEDAEAFRAVELAPVLAAHAPAARPEEEPGFSGGGGSFGGGGAGASF